MAFKGFLQIYDEAKKKINALKKGERIKKR